MFKGIRKLLPGHKLNLSKAKVRIDKYWDCDVTPVCDNKKGLTHYAEHLVDLLKDSIKRRLTSDVKLGFLLSGGLDSSTVVSLASELVQVPINTFSIGFKEKSYNELEFARMIAGKFGTQHYEYIVRPPIKNLLSKLVWHMEDPLADSSAIPTYYLTKVAKEHVSVVLAGDGGDELLAGYETYSAYKVANIYRKLPKAIRKGIVAKVVKFLPTSPNKVSFEYKTKRFVEGAELSPLRAHYWWNGTFGEEDKRKLYLQHVRESLTDSDTCDIFNEYFQRLKGTSILDKLLYVDTKLPLPDDGLTKVERMSMANALEVRFPFLDNIVVEFLTKLPSSFKLGGFFKNKYLLKKGVASLLPREIIHRHKSGFSIPLYSWLKGELKDMTLDMLSASRIKRQGLFDAKYINNLLEEHYSGKKNNTYSIWGLLTFSLWYDLFIERQHSFKKG